MQKSQSSTCVANTLARCCSPLLLLLLAACSSTMPWEGGGASESAQVSVQQAEAPLVCPAPPICPTVPAPVVDVPPKLVAGVWRDLPAWKESGLAGSWGAFQESCRGLASKPHGGSWKRVCDLARKVDGQNESKVREFYEAHFTPYAVVEGDGAREGMVTGYYEPLILGSRTRDGKNATPVLGVPDDMLTIDLGEVFPDLKYRRLRGRLEGNRVVPYWDRAEIVAKENKWPGKTLLWVQDPVEFFFLQIQGSGRVQLPDGKRVRIGYADQNGHPYRSIGKVLVERGAMKLEEASMQGIQAWARANPDLLPELLNTNPSYVFFRELPNTEAGPIGALGVPLTAERSIAVDPRHIPLGAPVYLSTTRPSSSVALNRLVMAQDTGGAIKGGVRADFFWGFGKEAGELAGRMKQRGQMWVLLPREAAPE